MTDSPPPVPQVPMHCTNPNCAMGNVELNVPAGIMLEATRQVGGATVYVLFSGTAACTTCGNNLSVG